MQSDHFFPFGSKICWGWVSAHLYCRLLWPWLRVLCWFFCNLRWKITHMAWGCWTHNLRDLGTQSGGLDIRPSLSDDSNDLWWWKSSDDNHLKFLFYSFEVEKFARNTGLQFFRTSVKENLNISHVFYHLAENYVESISRWSDESPNAIYQVKKHFLLFKSDIEIG